MKYRIFRSRSSFLTFQDLLPEDPKMYDKMRPPKKDDHPTVVHFHVTVMGLDSIDENSMVSLLCAMQIYFSRNEWKFSFVDVRRRHFLRSDLEGLPPETSWKYDSRLQVILRTAIWGIIIGSECFSIFFSNSGCSRWTGLRICGDQIHTSKTPNL